MKYKYAGNILSIIIGTLLYELTYMIIERYKVKILQALYVFMKFLLTIVKLVPTLLFPLLCFSKPLSEIFSMNSVTRTVQILLILLLLLWTINALIYYFILAIVRFLNNLKTELEIEEIED